MDAKTCPNCGLPNPASAPFCSCGFEFRSGLDAVSGPAFVTPPAERHVLVWIDGFLLGLYLWSSFHSWSAIRQYGPLQITAHLFIAAALVAAIWALERPSVWSRNVATACGAVVALTSLVEVVVEGDWILRAVAATLLVVFAANLAVLARGARDDAAR
jgi:hypothetical protein